MNLGRRSLSLLYAVLLLACAFAHAPALADTSKHAQKAYSPFDEPKPRTPQQMIGDKRLDAKVKVFCKSRNVKDLFADLSAKTGVKISTNRECSSQRVIIYFHNRPLRDVMTEVADALGLHWMASGKEGVYSYELFEDRARENRRDQAMRDMEEYKKGVLMDLANVLAFGGSGTGEPVDRIGSVYLAQPEDRNMLNLVRQFGADAVGSVFDGQRPVLRYADMPSGLQNSMCEQMNSLIHDHEQEYKLQEREVPLNRTPDDLMNATTTIELVTKDGAGRDMSVPRFRITMGDPSLIGSTSDVWPPWQVSLDQMLEATGRPTPETATETDALKSDTRITIDRLRWLPKGKGLLLGDVLEGIAVQSGKDVIADYYLQGKAEAGIKELKLDQVVRLEAAGFFNYSWQVSDPTIRFRYNLWYQIDPLMEPPSQIVEGLWSAIQQNGQLKARDLLSMSSLDDKQMKWPGLAFIPGADVIARFTDAIRVWGMLTADQETAARSAEGLHVSELSRQQAAGLSDVLAKSGVPASDLNIEDTKIAIRGSEMRSQIVDVELSGKRVVNAVLLVSPVISEADRKEIAAQRKADAEADVIEVL